MIIPGPCTVILFHQEPILSSGNVFKFHRTLVSISIILSSALNGAIQYPSEWNIGIIVSGDEIIISCWKVNPVQWVTYGIVRNSHLCIGGFHRPSVDFFGNFIIRIFYGVKSSTHPANQELANITIPNGVTTCFDATQVLSVAGNGTTFLVEYIGNVSLVAGHRIFAFIMN